MTFEFYYDADMRKWVVVVDGELRAANSLKELAAIRLGGILREEDARDPLVRRPLRIYEDN